MQQLLMQRSQARISGNTFLHSVKDAADYFIAVEDKLFYALHIKYNPNKKGVRTPVSTHFKEALVNIIQ